jgi:hypothetical protein
MRESKEESSSVTPSQAIAPNSKASPVKKSSQEASEVKSMNKRDKKHARKQQDQQNVGRGSEIKTETKTSQQASDQEDNAVEKTEAKRKDSVNKSSVAKATKNKDLKAMPEQQLS